MSQVWAGAGRRALALARRADDGRVDLEVPGGAEGRLGELELEPDHGVLAAALRAVGVRAGRRTAEERVHDVAEAEARTAAAEPAAAVAERVTAEVVDLLLLRVREHLVGGVDLLEPLLRLRVGVDVRVQLASQPAEGLLDLVLADASRRTPRTA